MLTEGEKEYASLVRNFLRPRFLMSPLAPGFFERSLFTFQRKTVLRSGSQVVSVGFGKNWAGRFDRIDDILIYRRKMEISR